MIRLFLFLFALLTTGPFAQAGSDATGTAPATKAEMISEARAIAPGSTFTIALKLNQPEGWHSYYLNSGGVEKSPAIEWTLPQGFTAGPILWPAPEVKDGYFGKSFVYFGSPVFLVDVTAPAALRTGETVPLTAVTTWQICSKLCREENKTFTLTLPIAAAVEKAPENTTLFANARASLPITATNWKISVQPKDGDFLIRLEPSGTLQNDPTDFIPDQKFVQAASDGGSIRREDGALLIRLKRVSVDAFDKPVAMGSSLSGILLGNQAVRIPDTPIVESGSPAQSLSFSRFLHILGGMLLGGMILNLMPCVFPVIGLKIMGFVNQSGSDRKKIALHGITFTLGVIVSFGVLSGILFAARSAAAVNSIGWGYQLQNPWVVLTLMMLMFVLALNMFGVFEVGIGATSIGGSLQSKHGLSGSFFSGVLATVVATPCSAPFLGPAIAIAIALPAFQFFTAFAAMAMGLALPYLVLSLFPCLVGFLPRPGVWMESFKQGMSFLLFAAAGYLLWVYAGQIEGDNLLGPIFGLCSVAVAAWIHGRWNLPHRKRGTRNAAFVLAILFAVTGVFLAKPPKAPAIVWEPWSEQRVTALLDEGRPVYIDFTAKWCATCQANKLHAYSKEVVELMKKKGVATLKGDKTRPDPQIEAALQKFGRSAIPVNVLLAPGKEPVILPELLTPGELLEALGKL